MEAYEGIATVYDRMMDNIPYEQWFKQICKYMKEYGIDKGKICELGCGSGAMTELFARQGFEMIGIDNSEDMLRIAMEKKLLNQLDITYVHQDMTEFELHGKMNAIISICDSMNHLLSDEEVLQTFKQVNKYLDKDGIFIFDIKTEYCYQNIIGNQTWAEQDEEVSYIWENYYYERKGINEYMLTIFKKEKDSDLYHRIQEAHYQKVYSVSQLKELLEESGLELLNILAEDMRAEPKESTERIYLVAKQQ